MSLASWPSFAITRAQNCISLMQVEHDHQGEDVSHEPPFARSVSLAKLTCPVFVAHKAERTLCQIHPDYHLSSAVVLTLTGSVRLRAQPRVRQPGAVFANTSRATGAIMLKACLRHDRWRGGLRP